MAKVQYGVKVRPAQKIGVGIFDLENMSLEMADEGNDTLANIFGEFNGGLVKVTFEAIPQE